VPLDIDHQSAPAAPVFVTLHLPRGELRGCMGTLVAREPDVRRETLRCAVLAATEDPRFAPLPLDELGLVTIDVTVLCPLEPIAGPELLDPKRYGVVVSDGQGRRGVLLPDLPGIDDVETQLRIVRRKAGISSQAQIDLKRFEALRFYEQ
jgi:AmmeMemoRadiSam system protein A